MIFFAMFCILIAFTSIPAMDIPKNDQKLIQQLFTSIKDYKYEETKKLITNHPPLLNDSSSYAEPGYFYQDHMTPLHVAAYVGNSNAVELLLSINSSLIHSYTKDKETPLHLAGNKRIAKLLLQHGAHIDAKDGYQKTPLYNFLFGNYENYDIAIYLLKHGADPNGIVSDYFKETLLHEAAHKNISSSKAKILLKYGANPELTDIEGNTPFDKAMEYGRKIELFKKVGINIIHLYPEEDPFELLKDNAACFKKLIKTNPEKRRSAERTLVNLFLICKKQESKSIHYNQNVKKISVCGDYYKYYLLKYITFADIEEYVGKEGVDYARKHLNIICHNALRFIDSVTFQTTLSAPYFVWCYDKKIAFALLKYMIENEEEFFNNFSQKADIKWVDEEGNSLLHYAALSHNANAIEWLIHKDIDCTILNKEKKTAIDYIQESENEDCQEAFFYTFHEKFLSKSLRKKNEKLIATKFFANHIYVFDNGRTLFFESLHKRPDKCLFFLKKGTFLNFKDNDDVSPLASIVAKWYKKAWEKIPNDMKYLILLLLEHNAVVEEKVIQQLSEGYLKDLLQQKYDNQKCCICWEHPEDLSNIPCVNAHPEFLCRECSATLPQNNCPMCRMPLEK